MPARLVEVTLVNSSRFPVIWQDDHRDWGDWQDPWYPSNLQTLMPHERGTFRMESDGILTGVEGWAYFMVDIFDSLADVPAPEYFVLLWDKPFVGKFWRHIDHRVTDPKVPAKVTFADRVGDLGEGAGFTEAMLYTLVWPSAPLGFSSDVTGRHIGWEVEVRNTPYLLAPGRTASPLVGQTYRNVTYIDGTPEGVWEALIRPELTVKYWYDMRIESPWTVGSKVSFSPKDAGRHTESGTVLEFAPPRRLSYTFKADPCQDCPETRITFTLEPQDGKVKLTLVHDQLPKIRTKGLHDAWRGILSSLKTMVESGAFALHLAGGAPPEPPVKSS